MKILYFIFFCFFVCSCDSSNQSSNKSIKNKISAFFVKFNKLDKKYKDEKRVSISQFYDKNIDSTHFSGMFLVAKNGEIIFEKYNGFANKEENQKIDLNTPIHVASISKVATSVAILRLVDQAKISLDQDIRDFLPEIPYDSITVRMLLNHRSGIPYYGYFTYKTWPLGKNLTNKEMLLLIQKHKFPLNFPSDSHFSYCNTNYALLALIIEQVTGKKFPKAMRELIFDPLKMDNSFILDQSYNLDDIAQSYNSRMVKQAFDYLDFVYGDKNMYSTARDLLKLDKATYSNAFLSKKVKEEMFKGYSYERLGTRNYGLGIRIVELENRKPYFFHTGWWHGNTGCYATLRGDTVCIVALSNSYNRSVYKIRKISPHFGNYPFDIEEE